MGASQVNSYKESACNAGNAGDTVLISRWGRSTGVGNGTHSSILVWENPMDRGACEVTESQTWLGDWAHTHHHYTNKQLSWLFPIFLTVYRSSEMKTKRYHPSCGLTLECTKPIFFKNNIHHIAHPYIPNTLLLPHPKLPIALCSQSLWN